jgi:uncharacterized protein (TIGR02145 family)
MRSNILIILFVSCFCTLKAQSYQISFTCSGESTTLDSVSVLNLTQCTSLTVSGSDTLHLFGTGGVSDKTAFNSGLKIYPNPMDQMCNIEFYNSKYGEVSIEIYDVTGEIKIQRSEKALSGKQTFSISGLEKGVYVINIITSENKITDRIISINENPQGVSLIKTENNNHFSSDRTVYKKTKSLSQMQYNDGERLLLKGISGDFSRVITLIPDQSQTVDFVLVKCFDGDNNSYPVVTIGNQTWMAENLKTTKYNNGDSIPYNIGVSSPAYCWYNNNYTTYGSIYGALYSWYTVDTISNGMRNVCPEGWHPASYSEWMVLSNYLGGNNVSGGKLKETCSIYWDTPNVGATNESGFTALPGGEGGSSFYRIHDSGSWWTSTYFNNGWAFHMWIDDFDNDMGDEWWMCDQMYSVRCVLDKE